MRTFFVCNLTDACRRLYPGVTSNLLRSVREHRHGVRCRFTHRCCIGFLVHFETFTDAQSRIAREKGARALYRPAELRLIEQRNADWLDMASLWFDRGGARLGVPANPQGQEIPIRFAHGMTGSPGPPHSVH